MKLSRSLLSMCAVVFGSVVVLAAAPLQAAAATVPAPAVHVTATASQLSPQLRRQVVKDVSIAKKLTVSRNGQLRFDSTRAQRLGMSRTFAEAYVAALRDGQAQSSVGDVGVYKSPKSSSIDCLIAVLGVSVGTAAAIAAVVASGGVLALALIGLSASVISLVRSCY